MSFHGIVLIDLVGLVLIALITNLVRTRLLYPGYASGAAGVVTSATQPATAGADAD